MKVIFCLCLTIGAALYAKDITPADDLKFPPPFEIDDLTEKGYDGIGIKGKNAVEAMDAIRFYYVYKNELKRSLSIQGDLRLQVTNKSAEVDAANALAKEWKDRADVIQKAADARARKNFIIGGAVGVGVGVVLTGTLLAIVNANIKK